MNITKFNISAILYFKSGNSKKVDWVEDKLVKRTVADTKESTESLTLAEADLFFQGKFKEWKENGTVVVRKNRKVESSIIPFSEIEYATVTVSVAEVTEIPEPHKVSDISHHPAFKK